MPNSKEIFDNLCDTDIYTLIKTRKLITDYVGYVENPYNNMPLRRYVEYKRDIVYLSEVYTRILKLAGLDLEPGDEYNRIHSEVYSMMEDFIQNGRPKREFPCDEPYEQFDEFTMPDPDVKPLGHIESLLITHTWRKFTCDLESELVFELL